MAPSHKKSVLSTSAKAVDPSLDALFSTSAKPVAPTNKPKYVGLITPKARPAPVPEPVKELDEEELAADEEDEEDEEDDDEDEDEEQDEEADEEEEETSDKAEDADEEVETAEPEQKKGLGKRKRKGRDDGEDLEGRYLDKLARETDTPAEKRTRRAEADAEDVDMDGAEEEVEDGDDTDEPIVHEALGGQPGSAGAGAVGVAGQETEREKAARTVFLSNVSIEAVTSRAAKKTLMAFLASPLEAMNSAATAAAAAAVAAAAPAAAETEEPSSTEEAAATPAPAAAAPVLATVESLRFRSVPFATAAMPKRAAYITKAVMGATAQATNAYAVYSTAAAARLAVRQLNGTVVLGRHLRADSVAHPSVVDHRRCVFVGNLGFMDDEEVLVDGEDGQAAEQTKKKRFKVPMDVEEGLWRTFGKHAGRVESVRVVRDPATRVGKGFAYVQFVDGTSVEAALLLAGRKYPPLLPRILRVSRCKAPQKTTRAVERQQQAASAKADARRDARKRTKYAPKPTAEQQSEAGRAAKMLGRAAARSVTASATATTAAASTDSKPLVFEGTRARAGQGGGIGGKKSRSGPGKGGPNKGGPGKGGKPSNNDERRAKRASSWRGKTKR